MECPNCGGDHFTTLRVPQKNLFSSTLAQPGRTGLVLTDLPPFIVTALPTNSLLLPQLYCHCGSLRDAHTQHMCARLCTNTRMHCKRGMQMCTHAHCTWHALPRVCTEPTETSGRTEEIGKIGIDFDDGTSQIKHMSIRNELEGVREMETHLFPY